MNTKNLLSLLLISTMTLVSCKKELQPQESSEALPADSTATAANTVTSPAAPAMPAMQQNPGAVAANPAPATQPIAVGKGMNPPHGQPGHRCDIAVGAPLNSPAAKPAIQQPAMTPGKGTTINPSGSNASSTPVVTAPGMNPPHGQAGHRCDIAVGSPLSTPVKTASTPAAAPALLAAPAETIPVKE
jgi:hypothetical protein